MFNPNKHYFKTPNQSRLARIILTILIVFVSLSLSKAQIIQEGAGSASNARSISKNGFRAPQVNALPAKPDLNNYTGDSASGAFVYCKCLADTSKKGLYYWRTNKWVRVDSAGGGSAISLIGRTSGIVSSPTPAGNGETWLGQGAGASNSDTNQTVYLGYYAGNNTGGGNAQKQVAVGYYAANAANYAYNSNFIGVNAGDGATYADKSNFMGHRAGYQAVHAYRSNFFGRYTGYGATNAYYSNFFGHMAGYNSVNLSHAIAIGDQAGYNDAVDNSSGSTSILIGDQTGTGGNANSIALGKSGVNNRSNQFLVAAAYNNWQIAGKDYIMPSAYGAANTVLMDVDGAGTLAWNAVITPADTAAMMANAVIDVYARNDTAFYVNSTGEHFGFEIGTAANGITKTSNVYQLGGALNQTTVLNTASYGLQIASTSGSVNPLYLLAYNGYALHAHSDNNHAILAGSGASGTSAVYAQNVNGLAGTFIVIPSSTNTVVPAINIARQSQGTPTDSIGVSADFVIQDSDSTGISNSIISRWVISDHTTRKSDLSITGVNGGVISRLLRLGGDGQLHLDHYGDGTFAGTPAYLLASDASHNVIETSLPASFDSTSLSNRINAKLDTLVAQATYVPFADTATMLSNYAHTATVAAQLALKLNLSDTATMLANYAHTATVAAQLALKLNLSDTATMLANYAHSATVAAQLALKLNLSDTATMLANYAHSATVAAQLALKLNLSDTATMLANYAHSATVAAQLALKLNLSDTATMLANYAHTGTVNAQLALKVDSCTVSADSTTLYYWKNGTSHAFYRATTALTGGDTTIFQTVLDSTGAPSNRILFAGGNKIKSDSYFLYDSVNNKVVINGTNISVGSTREKLWVQGNATVSDTLSIGAPLSQSDTASYKPLVIAAAGGKLYRLNRWPTTGGSTTTTIFPYPNQSFPTYTNIDSAGFYIYKATNATGGTASTDSLTKFFDIVSLGARSTNPYGGGAIRFITTESTSNTTAERMRIDKSGNVSITGNLTVGSIASGVLNMAGTGVLVGNNAGVNNSGATTGNTFVGYKAGNPSGSISNTHNTAIGENAGVGATLWNGATYNVILGANVPALPTITGSNQLKIGGNSNGWITRFTTGAYFFNVTTSDVTTQSSGATFEINGTGGGLLIPRLTTTQMNAVSTPTTGVEIFNSDYANKMIYNGVTWSVVQNGAYIAKTANYTVLKTDYLVDCTSNSFTITLPTAVGWTGKEFIIKNTGSSTTITIATTSSQTIDGASPGTITTVTPLRLMSNGSNWITF